MKTATDVMRRKAGEGRPAPEIGRMTPARAWKLALPHAAQDTLGVQAAAMRVEESRVVQGDLPGLVPEHGLIALLEGPEERFGIAVIDSPTLAGLIEATTTGRIASRPPVPREPTRTDAIISADLLDALLDGFEASLAEMDDPPNLGGYRYAAPLADLRAIEMTLAEGSYSVFRLTVDLGGGVRQGDVTIAFPIAARGAAHGRDVAAFQKALAENVMGAPTELDACLFRLQMPISEVSGLAAGDVLKLPLSALAAVEVHAGGKPVATARLGQQSGFRAARITSLAGAEEDQPEDGSFEDAAPTRSIAALPAGDFGFGDEADYPDMDDPAGSGALPDLGDLSPGGELPDIPDLPPLDGGVDGPSPIEAGALPDLPPLDGDEDSGLPDIPGLPPLTG